ncbi:indole-3-glycerol phosphate synthase-domain-containing protein [Amylostereum chailletii]|nr:indole-3-glycerol phosphate synthase-domain-containing protein [Amylostereum chailletii]
MSEKLPTILQKIHAQRSKDVEAAKATPGSTYEDLLASLTLAPPLISFPDRLRAANASGPALMAEIKRASPSKGDIDIAANAPRQARTYALAGAAVISVLTEPTWFKGTLLDMRLARQALDALPHRPAVLRKDFIFDEYQILEARVWGADTVLLIVAMLDSERLAGLYAFAQGLGMEPLVEVNNAQEMEAALELGARVIGVNNRNLHDFSVDMGTTTRLADMVQAQGGNAILCALSGIKGPEDVKGYVDQGVGAVLVGESLMRATDVRAFIRELLSLPAEEAKEAEAPAETLVKVDGVTLENVGDARVRAAHLVGVYLSPNHPKAVSVADASTISVALNTNASPAAAVVTSPAPRQATGAQEDWFAAHARRIRDAGRPLLVGILDDNVQLTLDEIVRVVHAARLDAVQLASSAPVEWARHIPAYVIRSMVAQSVLAGGVLTALTRPGYHHAVLIRGKAGGYVMELKELVEAGVPVVVLEEGASAEVRAEIGPWAVCSQL